VKKFLWILFWFIAGPAALLVVGSIFYIAISSFSGSSRNNVGPTVQNAAQINAMVASQLRPDGELAKVFTFLSDATDIQRSQLQHKIENKIVDWSLPVYDVSEQSENDIVVQTETGSFVGTFVHFRNPNESTKSRLIALKVGNILHFKGVVKDVFLRSLVIDPAALD
jgi:hypothetical protein